MAEGVAGAGGAGSKTERGTAGRYRQKLEERAREGLDEEALRELRRGWVLGGEGFRDRVLDWMKKTARAQGGKYRGEETDNDHGERQAERIIREMLEALGLEEAELLRVRKGDWRKRLIGPTRAPGD